MLALLLNLGFAAGGTVTPPSTGKNTTSTSTSTSLSVGSFSRLEYDRALIRKRKIQQGYLKDDEELLAIMIATLTRRKK